MAAVLFGAASGAAHSAELQYDVPDNLRDDVEAASTLRATLDGPDPSPIDIVSAAQADYARIVGALYELGFYGPVVSIRLDGREAAALPPFQEPSQIGKIRVSVTPGPKFRFGQAAIGPLADNTEVPEAFATGEQARTSVVRDAVRAGVTGWRAKGFAKAALADQQITAVHAERRLDVDLTMDPGPRLRFGTLQVSGNDRVRADAIIRIAGLEEGRRFSPEALEQSATRLRRTGAFRSVRMLEGEAPASGDALPVTAEVVEFERRRIGVSAEIASLEGLSVSAYWLHRNLLGGAERLRFEAEVEGIEGDSGGIDSRLSVRFDRPGTFRPNIGYYALGEIEERNEINYNARWVRFENGLVAITRDDRTFEAGVGYIAGEVEDAFGSSDFQLLTFPLRASADRRDIPLDARDGHYLEAEVLPYLGLSGTSGGARLYADARGYRSFGPEQRLTFAGRVQTGVVTGPSQSEAPADFLFFSGGSDTVRGHAYQSLGVDLGNGRVAGGRTFVGLSGELRMRTSGALSVVGFYDAGFIGPDDFSVDNGDWHSGAGVGVRYDTGIGPIRLDLGWPVTGPDDPSGVQIYIGIGQAF